MADLGDLMGSLMCGLIRARRMADEQTAALAEYYKSNPLLEGLSVPRIRIPELTIDLPLLIEDDVAGAQAQMADHAVITAAADAQLKATLSRNDIKINPAFHRVFILEMKHQLDAIKQSGASITQETIARGADNAFADALAKTKITLSGAVKEAAAMDLRNKVSAVGLGKEALTPSILANIKTADVKERASDANVVRLKITLKEEGLEWATQSSESGGVIRTLQPE